MPNIPTHVAKLLFDDAGSGARRNQGRRSARARFSNQPRGRHPARTTNDPV